MKSAAGPVAPVSAPSSTTASKVRLSPSSTGAEMVTTASATSAPASTETVAFGGSMLAWSSPSFHFSTNCAVSM